MKTYILRRLLLMPITLLGVTFIVFCVTRFVPGGPIEQQLQQQALGAAGGQKATGDRGDAGLSEADMERLEEQYGLQEPIVKAYMQWLGLLPREVQISREDFRLNPEDKPEAAEGSYHPESKQKPGQSTRVLLSGTGEEVLIERTSADSKDVVRAVFPERPAQGIASEGWHARIESPRDRAERWARRMRENDEEKIKEREQRYFWRAVVHKTEFDGLLQGSLGKSFKYNESVWGMICERIPISLYFGLLSAIITYSVCIPLGIVKAIRHKSWIDNLSSVLIFIGYSVPGFALGAILVVYLGARMEWFPISGFTSPDFSEMTFGEQIKDLAMHTILPLTCYVVSSFAMMTMMMKNNLMDNLSADYIRTAMAKGVSFRRAVFGHAFRNSFIPIATTLGSLVGILVTGSMLIERMFDIQGFGMLSYQAVIDKDYSLIMGTLTLSAFLMILGSLISDIIVSVVDPRIKFD